jgi:magnesium-transporting ATPase (P-type)
MRTTAPPAPAPPRDAADPAAAWHARPADDVVGGLATDARRGLDDGEAARRLAEHGPNRLAEQSGPSALRRLWDQLRAPLVLILLAAGVLAAVLREWVDAGVILAVVVVNAGVGFFQEARALAAIGALARSMTHDTTVIRGGTRRRVPSDALVPGDLVALDAGDRVPADLRLVETRELRVDESALTGESVPVDKTPDALAGDTPLAERTAMAYASALVTAGSGLGVVVATGDATEVGRIQQLIASAEVLATPLTRRINRFSHVLLLVVLAVSALMVGIGLVRGLPTGELLMATVALAVGAIPEGLPAVLTITLAVGVSRMARRRAIVRRLPAVETLGSTTIICSDKTGTLTENQMTVRELEAGGRRFAASGSGYAPAGAITPAADGDASGGTAADDVALRALLVAAALCGDARVVPAPDEEADDPPRVTTGDSPHDGAWKVEGDPTEGALVVVARKGGLDLDALADAWERRDTLPFDSAQQFMATRHARPAEDPAAPAAAGDVLFAKGAVERIVPRCHDVLGADGRPVPLDADAVQEAAARMAAEGLRVLAVGRRSMSPGDDGPLTADMVEGLTFLGLAGMLDPPRASAAAAVRACRDAGVRVVMITGDHAATALAIAEQLGIVDDAPVPETPGAPDAGDDEPEDDARVLTGRELERLAEHPEAFAAAAVRTNVFARVAPEQKLRLVEALQAHGEVVAMTGDGVNDAPALRRADIGVAMGGGGTEVAKEAADIVLADDNFATIEAAVEEGRGVYDNLVKYILWTLPTNLGEGIVILVAFALSIALPILPVQILWINMTTAVALGLPLAIEPKEPGLMERPPRDPSAPLLTRGLIGRLVFVGLVLVAGAFWMFFDELTDGASEAAARTAAVNFFVLGETAFLFNCRSLTLPPWDRGLRRNGWLLAAVAAMVGAQLAFTYVPFMHGIFQSAPVSPGTWVQTVAAAAALFAAIEVEKWLRRRGDDARRPRRRARQPRPVLAAGRAR